MDDPIHEICERVAEAQAILHDHVEGGKFSAGEVVEKLQALMSERDLLKAMHAVGYFPRDTPLPGPGER